MKINAQRYKEFLKAKDDRCKEIVYMLDAFQGQLSLQDVLNYELPFLNDLKTQRIKMGASSKPAIPITPVK